MRRRTVFLRLLLRRMMWADQATRYPSLKGPARGPSVRKAKGKTRKPAASLVEEKV